MFKQMVITPFVGIGEIKLMSKINDIKEYLDSNKIQNRIEVWQNKGCTPEVPWTIIRVENCVSLFFAKDILWKIYLTRGYEGALQNGIRIGTKTNEALKIDQELENDDWLEIYVSKKGYWLEDSLETGEIESITVFIPEALDEDLFNTYAWAEKN